MDKRGLVVGIVATVLLLGAADRSSGVIVQFSLDGENPAPDELDVVPGEIFTMYIVSYSPGESYLKQMDAPPLFATIGDVWVYPEAGDLASVLGLADSSLMLSANDSMGEILAGKHFGFDVNIGIDAPLGEVRHFYLWDSPVPDDSLRITVVPEPGTVALLSLGGLVAFRRRRSR